MMELHDIMTALNEIEYGMDCLINVMYTLDEAYDLNYDDASRILITVLLRQISSLHDDLENEIAKLDDYLATPKKCETN
jgi:hypothetical protein